MKTSKSSQFIRTSGLKDTQIEQLSLCFEILGMEHSVTIGGIMNEIYFGGCHNPDKSRFANGKGIDAFFDKNGMFLHMVQR